MDTICFPKVQIWQEQVLSNHSINIMVTTLVYFSNCKGFPEKTLNTMITNSGNEKKYIHTKVTAITCGGMRGLKDLADACVFIAKESSTSHRFISPGIYLLCIDNR